MISLGIYFSFSGYRFFQSAIKVYYNNTFNYNLFISLHAKGFQIVREEVKQTTYLSEIQNTAQK